MLVTISSNNDNSVVAKILLVKGEKGDTGESADYEQLSNLPSINGVSVTGDKNLNDYGIYKPQYADENGDGNIVITLV